MKIVIEGIVNTTMNARIKQMIKDKQILTWEYVIEDKRTRLMHTGDKQYEDVLLTLRTKEGENKVTIEPKVKEGVKDTETAQAHFGVVMGRFAELLNCHFDDIKSYKTFL